MELDNSPGMLHIATGDWQVVKDLVSMFNKGYTSSELLYHSSVEIDGVLFSYIDARNASLDHVFLFGASYESYVSELREAGKIDW